MSGSRNPKVNRIYLCFWKPRVQRFSFFLALFQPRDQPNHRQRHCKAHRVPEVLLGRRFRVRQAALAVSGSSQSRPPPQGSQWWCRWYLMTTWWFKPLELKQHLKITLSCSSHRSRLLPPATSISGAFQADLRSWIPQQRREELPVARSGFCYPASWSGGPGGGYETCSAKVCLQGVRYGGLYIWTFKPSRSSICCSTVFAFWSDPSLCLMCICQAFNWLLCNVIQTTCLHDILWHFVASLTPSPSEPEDEEDEENKGNKENVEQVGGVHTHTTRLHCCVLLSARHQHTGTRPRRLWTPAVGHRDRRRGRSSSAPHLPPPPSDHLWPHDVTSWWQFTTADGTEVTFITSPEPQNVLCHFC